MKWLVRDTESVVHVAHNTKALCGKVVHAKSYMASDAVTCLECVAHSGEPVQLRPACGEDW